MNKIFVLSLAAFGILTVLFMGSQKANAGLWFFQENTITCQNIDGHWGTKVICTIDIFESCTAEECSDPTCNPPECGGGGGGGTGGGTGCDPNCPTCGLGCDPFAN